MQNLFNYRLYSPSYSSYVSGIKYSCSQWIFHDLWNWLIRHWWLSFKVFFFTTRLLKNCYQDTCLKSEEFCTNGLCLIFAISIKRLHRRATNVNLAQKNGEFALNCVWERKCFDSNLYLWIDFIYWLNWNISFPIILEDSLWLIEKDELSGKQRIVYVQTQLSMVCHSICSKQTAARDYFRMSPSSDVSEVVKENEWETDGERITSCHSYMYSPKKMRPEDLPKFPEQRLVIELRLAYPTVCRLYLCLRNSNGNGGRSRDRWLVLLTSCWGIPIWSSYIALMSAFSTTLVFWMSPHPIS